MKVSLLNREEDEEVVEEEEKDKDSMGPHDGQPRNNVFVHMNKSLTDFFSSSLYFPSL